ncbi:MAG TPA: hypothetical protein VN929_18635 [Burkholderiales bacterium]|nr:hypothetical protein [Burkholderiales bacterium]
MAVIALAPAKAAAHAFAARYDLPLPLSLWLAAAGLTIALSFVVFALALRRGGSASYPRLDLLRLPAARALARLALHALRAVSVFVFVVLIAAGLFGTQEPFRNLVPTFVWIAWWIGFTYLSATAGDLWALLNPWKALYVWAEAIARRMRPAGRFGLRRSLPEGVGVWPAAALLLAFGWIEIVWEGNAVPANIAVLALGYSLLTWTGMFVFGREAWLSSGEVFTVYFGWLARLAPSEVRASNAAACEWNLRPPAAGLLDPRPVSTSAAFFVIIMLATVTFDGLRETPLWAVSDSLWAAAATAGLLALPCLFALAILGACAWMAWLTRGDARPASAGELARLFVPTLLPIAFAYHVAHYLSYLLVAGQVVIPLASDPFGRGWDLFGTAHYKIAVGIVGARFAWYTSVIVIVLGHVLAMYVAHRLALERFSGPRIARRSQYPLAALMVGYTMLSLWILAHPIVETVK